MIPSWMIEDIEGQRGEPANRELARLPMELPVGTEDEAPPRHPQPSAPIVIRLGATHERSSSRGASIAATPRARNRAARRA